MDGDLARYAALGLAECDTAERLRCRVVLRPREPCGFAVPQATTEKLQRVQHAAIGKDPRIGQQLFGFRPRVDRLVAPRRILVDFLRQDPALHLHRVHRDQFLLERALKQRVQ
ncbi:MAG: hypothetical protein M3680_02815 [Myxococcota bacterium]|nr:hypothetical protein [Myxococcota bacterium]